MSRSGYVDDIDPFELGRYRQAVRRAIKGKRGQAFLRELINTLDAMEDKRLWPGNFATPDGEYCALGVVGAKRGLPMADLGDYDDCDPEFVGARFGIAKSMAAEIMYKNDDGAVPEWTWHEVEICGPMRWTRDVREKHQRFVRIPNENAPEKRWQAMRDWAAKNLLVNRIQSS